MTMINITLDTVKNIFPHKDFERGYAYWNDGRVSSLKETFSSNDKVRKISADVYGTEEYHPVAYATKAGALKISCDCMRFRETGRCKHLAAMLIAYSFTGTKGDKAHSRRADPNTRKLLDAYMDRSRRKTPETPARLVPRLLPGDRNWSYPVFSFRVGYDKLYVVKNLEQFLEMVDTRQTFTYGKGLTLFHGMEQFDGLSQDIIRVLMDELPGCRARGYGMSSYASGFSPRSIFNGQALLTGSAFDRMFDLLRGQEIETDIKNETYLFQDGDPNLEIKLRRKGNGEDVRLLVNTEGEFNFFGNERSLYACMDGRILRCSETFREKAWPLLTLRSDRLDMSQEDLSLFCSFVLPAIEDIVKVEAAKGLIEEHIPDECSPCFYFDMENSTLTLKLMFRYPEKEIPAFAKMEDTPGIKRDMSVEMNAEDLAGQYFTKEEQRYELTGDDAIYAFLTRTIDFFREQGEVFITNRLRAKHISPSGSKVGLSVSNGILTMDLDTGDFPPEELEALYNSMLQRRRYHKLPDGRYLTLDGSPYETLAEAAHMLQIPQKELKKGTVQLPAYRAPYLDSVLSDGVRVSRDKNLRDMIRNFKSVAESDYAVPEGLENVLRPYQKVGFQWLKTLESCGFGGILADEMGLGKTIQAIAFLVTASRGTTGLPNLVVCPTSLILNWDEEIKRFAPELNIMLIMGNAAQRRERLHDVGNYDVIVTSYELLRQDIEKYAEIEFYCCLLDEGQHIKNQSTLASKAVKMVVCKQRFVLTGTPIENRLSELWNLFDFLMPGYLYSHSAFVDKLEKPIVKSKNEEASQQLRRLVQPFMLRRIKSNVLKELPPKLEHVRRVQLSEDERKLYLSCAQQAKNELLSGEGKLKVLAALTRLRQVCCDPDLCFENYEGPESKLEACMELCSGMVSNGHQILLFSQFTSMLDRLRAGLNKLGISHYTLQGSTPKEQRAKLVKDFNAGGASVFLISLKAGGTGLNLTAADVVIHYDPWWNQAAQEQGTGRAHRIGQESTVQVYKLIAKDTIEEKILELQERKAQLMDAVSGESGESLLSMSQDDLMDLLNVRE